MAWFRLASRILAQADACVPGDAATAENVLAKFPGIGQLGLHACMWRVLQGYVPSHTSSASASLEHVCLSTPHAMYSLISKEGCNKHLAA
mmetsp:Transcript_12744/g.36146  ORF Transcript_12744/g.36146 Transcript_12744/m.36146 type:complete len:90 (-) Transcript_12744:94-363(-)